jgi:LAO/AO transport system kinase
VAQLPEPDPRDRIEELNALRAGGKAAVARALTRLETERGTKDLAQFLDACVAHPRAHVLGLTGPPGVGKSTLTNALVQSFRARGETVAVIAVDPTSHRTGGALLGDRTRIRTAPDDDGAFVRSMAARDRLGGLSPDSIAATVVLRAVFDHVLVESVGIGQSEADIALVSDTVILCIQPGSGDSLQFMKAGIMELPDIIAVTKSDMGAAARRAVADVEGALGLYERAGTQWTPPVMGVSAVNLDGVDDLVGAVASHRSWLEKDQRLKLRRHAQAVQWVQDWVRARFGTKGVERLEPADLRPDAAAPFSAIFAANHALD